LTTVNIDQYNQYMENDWISAEDALAKLSIKPQTLYAYVSRGLLRSQADPNDSRKSLYSHHDVHALLERKRRPRGRADVAAAAISWGDPVLESGISTVRDGQLYFGPDLAIDLASYATLEDVAAKHWAVSITASDQPSLPIPSASTAKARGYAFLADEASNGTPSLGRTLDALANRDGVRLLSGFADAMIGARHAGSIHTRLQTAWQLSDADGDIIRRALILLSDHELNPSAFAVRVAASTGPPLAAAVLAGYATLNGPRHGNASSLAMQFLTDATQTNDLGSLIGQHSRLGGYTMGFGHALYPGGDPRAIDLLSALNMPPKLAEIITETEHTLGHKPNIDAALSAMAMTLNLPKGAPFCLFAISRMAGWLAHAMEQVASGQMIRPRANFVPR
jgi:citrate synthase